MKLLKNSVILLLILTNILLASKIALIENNGIISLGVGSITTVEEVFNKLSEYYNSNGKIKSYVPKGILNAYYFVDTALIIDLNTQSVNDYNSNEEIFFILQILYSLFENIKGIDRIYVIVNGKQTNILIKSVNIYFSFPKQLYQLQKGD